MAHFVHVEVLEGYTYAVRFVHTVYGFVEHVICNCIVHGRAALCGKFILQTLR